MSSTIWMTWKSTFDKIDMKHVYHKGSFYSRCHHTLSWHREKSFHLGSGGQQKKDYNFFQDYVYIVVFKYSLLFFSLFSDMLIQHTQKCIHSVLVNICYFLLAHTSLSPI